MWVVVLRVPDGGALVLDSESPTLSSVQNAHLFIQTPSANRSIFVTPHGTGQVVVGGYAPSVVSQSTAGLRLGGAANATTGGAQGNVTLRHGSEGMVVIAGPNPVLAAAPNHSLTLLTGDDKDIVLSPTGLGAVEVVGTQPQVRSDESKALRLVSGETTAEVDGDIELLPSGAGAVVVGGADPQILSVPTAT